MKIEKLVKIMSALANDTRLRIFGLFLKREMCVCEVEAALGIEQSRISHALRILREAGLLDVKKEGKWKIYSVNRDVMERGFMKNLSKEIVLPKKDLEGLDRCIREGVRESCK